MKRSEARPISIAKDSNERLHRIELSNVLYLNSKQGLVDILESSHVLHLHLHVSCTFTFTRPKHQTEIDKLRMRKFTF